MLTFLFSTVVLKYLAEGLASSLHGMYFLTLIRSTKARPYYCLHACA